MRRDYSYLSVITALYVTFQLVSDVSAGKLTLLFGVTVPATIWYYPLVFVFSDVLTEVYGYAHARRVAWTAFLCTSVATLVYQLVIYLPASPLFITNDAYVTVLGAVPRIVVSGIVAGWCGALANDYVLAKMKVWTNGKHLWTRTIGSTIVGESVVTCLFYVLAFGGTLPVPVLLTSILVGTAIKIVIEVACTPWVYVVASALKRLEHEDYYDRETNFNPFSIRVSR